MAETLRPAYWRTAAKLVNITPHHHDLDDQDTYDRLFLWAKRNGAGFGSGQLNRFMAGEPTEDDRIHLISKLDQTRRRLDTWIPSERDGKHRESLHGLPMGAYQPSMAGGAYDLLVPSGSRESFELIMVTATGARFNVAAVHDGSLRIETMDSGAKLWMNGDSRDRVYVRSQLAASLKGLWPV